MRLRLVVEHSPHRQPVPELVHTGGDISIGRGTDADWRLEDPDMFISRKHCLVTADGDRFTVTDMSRGGLFVDGAETPLGPGRSCALHDGTRLRLGDVVLRAEVQSAGPAMRPVADAPSGQASFAADDFFAQRPIGEAPPPRPASLPEPFDRPRSAAPPAAVPPRDAPPLFDDPFTLDPLPSHGRAPPEPEPQPHPPPAAPPVPPLVPSPAQAPDSDSGRPASPPDRRVAEAPTRSSEAARAFLKGLGLDPTAGPDLGPEEMERLGWRFRALVEALEQSLRTRAREKRSLRVAQTVIGSSDVNPLKFLVTTEDILQAMIGPARPGYMDGDDAIAAAVRDLADHQVRSWTGLQASLRRMIERFDPEEIEREMEAAGRLRAILAGGRGALLWQLYRERFQSIAKAAEDRFLGEVGSDYREAYEGGRTNHDG